MHGWRGHLLFGLFGIGWSKGWGGARAVMEVGAEDLALTLWNVLFQLPYTAAAPAPACCLSLIVVLCICPSAGPEVNPALLQQQKREEEAALAKEASCSKHPIPMSTAGNVYVNSGFEHPDKSVNSSDSSQPHKRQKF